MFVFSNLAISLDGKISTRKRILFPLGTAEDRRQMSLLRLQCDALLMGASTLRSFRKPCVAQHPQSTTTQPTNVVLSSSLDRISPDWPFFSRKNLKRILLVGPEVLRGISRNRLRKFERTSEIFALKKPTLRNPAAAQALKHLENRGVQRLLIEGGGTVMWDFVAQDLIDEYHVTITPRLLGGRDAPTLVDGEGFDPKGILSLKLRQCRVVGDEIFLVYHRGREIRQKSLLLEEPVRLERPAVK